MPNPQFEEFKAEKKISLNESKITTIPEENEDEWVTIEAEKVTDQTEEYVAFKGNNKEQSQLRRNTVFEQKSKILPVTQMIAERNAENKIPSSKHETKINVIDKEARALKVDNAIKKLIKNVFTLLPSGHDIKEGDKFPHVPPMIKEKNLTPFSPSNIREAYGSAVVPIFYNILVDGHKPFLMAIDALEDLVRTKNKASFILNFITDNWKKLLNVAWNIGIMRLKNIYPEMISLDASNDEDECYGIPLGIDDNSIALLSYIEDFIEELCTIQGFPNKTQLAGYIEEAGRRITWYNRVKSDMANAEQKFSELIEPFQDLRKTVKDYPEEKLKDLMLGIEKAMSPFDKMINAMTEFPPAVQAFSNNIKKEFAKLSNELNEKTLTGQVTQQEIADYEYLSVSLINMSSTLTAYGINISLSTEFQLAEEIKQNVFTKLNTLKAILSKKATPAFDPCHYLDQVCEQLTELLTSTSCQNQGLAKKIKDTINGIKLDKTEYMANQESVRHTYIKGLDNLQNKVTDRLNGIIKFGKYHAILHRLHQIYNVIYEIFQNVISVFSEAKKAVKTANVLSAKERYETSRGLFAVKQDMKKQFKTVIKAAEEDARIRVKSYF